MVKLEKSELPKGISICKADDYRNRNVLDILANDCYSKCYLCENGPITSIQVEHLIPENISKDDRYNWQNLLYSCSHCNGIKGHVHHEIINCLQDDPEEYLDISMSIEHMMEDGDIKIKVIGSKPEICDKINGTKELLELIYNHGNKEKKSARSKECEELRKLIRREMVYFINCIMDYFDNAKEAFDREYCLNSIKRSLARSAPFAGLKRSYVRNNSTFFSEFKEFLV